MRHLKKCSLCGYLLFVIDMKISRLLHSKQKLYVLFISLLLVSIGNSQSTLHGQSKSDSLLFLIQQANSDTVKMQHYLQLGDLFKGSVPDTAKYFYLKATAFTPKGADAISVKRMQSMAYIGLASLMVYQGDYEEAIRFNTEASKIAYANGFIQQQAVTENMIGLVHFNKSEFAEAMVQYEKALKLAEKAKDELFMAKVYTNMAIINFYQGNYEDATRLFKRPVEIARKLNNLELLAGNLLNVGLVYFNISQADSAISYYSQASEIYEKLNALDGLLLCYKNMGTIYYEHGSFIQAMDIYQRSIDLCMQVNDQSSLAKNYHNCAELYTQLGDYETALSYYLKGLEIKETLGDQMAIAASLKGIGSLHFLNDEYAKTLYYYKQTLETYEKIEYKNGIAGVYADMANVYFHTNQMDTSLWYSQKALEMYKVLDDVMGQSDAYINLGMVNYKKGRLLKGKNLLLKGIALKTELQDMDGQAIAYGNLSLIESKLKNKKEAIKYAEKSWDMAKQLEALPITVSASEILSKAYKDDGNYIKAIKFSELHATLQDSLYNLDKAKAVANAETRWQSEKKQSQIDKLEAQREIDRVVLAKKEAESKTQKAIIAGIVSVFVFTILLVLVFYNSLQRKRDLQLERQKVSITNLRMQNIRNRISPHFFFNALSSAALPLNNFPEHKQAFDNLVKLLKSSLENVEHTVIPLSSELEMVEAYLQLQQLKMDSAISFTKNITMSGINNVFVPAMIVQIPIENAIKHGLAVSSEPKELCLDCTNENGVTKLTIKDNGVGRRASSGQTAGTGTGLKVLLQIIQIFNARNDKKINFFVKDAYPDKINNSGTIVEITIPDGFDFQLAS